MALKLPDDQYKPMNVRWGSVHSVRARQGVGWSGQPRHWPGQGRKAEPPPRPKSKRGQSFRSGPGATRTRDLLLGRQEPDVWQNMASLTSLVETGSSGGRVPKPEVTAPESRNVWRDLESRRL